jgi:hypothetical protein
VRARRTRACPVPRPRRPRGRGPRAAVARGPGARPPSSAASRRCSGASSPTPSRSSNSPTASSRGARRSSTSRWRSRRCAATPTASRPSRATRATAPRTMPAQNAAYLLDALPRLHARVGTLTLRLQPPGAVSSVVIDNRHRADWSGDLALDPGPHTVLIRTRDGQVIRREVSVVEGSRDAITLTLGAPAPPPAALAPDPYAPAPAAAPARGAEGLRIDSPIARARVTVDGQELGEAPVTPSLTTGRHQVEVQADGFRPARLALLVRDGAVTRVSPRLEREEASRGDGAFYTRWWFWTLVGRRGGRGRRGPRLHPHAAARRRGVHLPGRAEPMTSRRALAPARPGPRRVRGGRDRHHRRGLLRAPLHRRRRDAGGVHRRDLAGPPDAARARAGAGRRAPAAPLRLPRHAPRRGPLAARHRHRGGPHARRLHDGRRGGPRDAGRPLHPRRADARDDRARRGGPRPAAAAAADAGVDAAPVDIR